MSKAKDVGEMILMGIAIGISATVKEVRRNERQKIVKEIDRFGRIVRRHTGGRREIVPVFFYFRYIKEG